MSENVHKLYAHQCCVCGRTVKPALGDDEIDEFIKNEMPEPEAVFCSDQCFNKWVVKK